MNTLNTKLLNDKYKKIRIRKKQKKKQNTYEKTCSKSCPFIACLKDWKATHCFMLLSKLFQIQVPLYANVRWPEAVLCNGICSKLRLWVWRAWILERLVSLV